MSITTDLRSYADKAAQQAQAQLNDVSGQANELYGKAKENVSEIAGKATSAVHDLRLQAEKALNLDAIKTAVEPYLAQVKDYTSTVTDRAEGLFSGVKSVKDDKRVAKLVDAARPVVDVVETRVVKPVQSLIARDTKPAKRPAAKPAPTAAATKPASKPAATKPASKPASKPAARKSPAKRTTKS